MGGVCSPLPLSLPSWSMIPRRNYSPMGSYHLSWPALLCLYWTPLLYVLGMALDAKKYTGSGGRTTLFFILKQFNKVVVKNGTLQIIPNLWTSEKVFVFFKYMCPKGGEAWKVMRRNICIAFKVYKLDFSLPDESVGNSFLLV